MELMMDSREIRKEPAAQTPPLPPKPLRIASWNVRTLYEAGKSSELTNEMKRNKLDILGVCETHLTDSEKTLLGTGEIMLRSGRKDNFHAEGVALLLGKRVQKSLIGWDPIIPMIL